MSPRAWPAGAALAASAAYLAVGARAQGGPAALATNLLQAVAAALAAAACLAAARPAGTRLHRAGWRLLALACAAWALGQAAWTWHGADGQEVPFPSLADAGFLAAVPLLAVGLVLLGPRVGPATRLRIVLDGLLTASLLLLILWIVVLRGLAGQAGDGTLALAIALAYPLGDVVLGAVALNVATRAPADDRAVWVALGVGVAGWALADSGFAYLATLDSDATGEWTDVGGFAGFLAVAVAAGLARRKPLADQASDALRLTNLGVPWMLLGVAVALAVREQVVVGVLDPSIVYLGVAMVSLLVARQLVSQVEIRRLNDRLKRANRELAAALAERERGEEARQQLEVARREARFRTEFLNGAAHELATPLTPLRLELDVLRSLLEGHPDPDVARHLGILGRNLARLTALSQDLLMSARLDLDRLALKRQPTDLDALVAQAVDDAAPHGAARGVAVTAGRAPGPVEADVDPRRFAEVLANLVGNAVKFTPAGGSVTASAALEGAEAVVRVADTGIGMDAAQLGRLFQPFVEVHAHGATLQSTGLGLYISRGLVERHGGTLTASSPGPGQGAVFTARVPRVAPPEPPRPPGPPPVPPDPPLVPPGPPAAAR